MSGYYDLSRLIVLVADPQFNMRSLLRVVLRALGVGSVVDASSVEEAYAILNKRPADIVLADWSPTFSGLGLVQRLRKAGDSPDPFIPVIIVSAHTETVNVERARDAGANSFLAKPFSAQLIHQRIVSVVESSHPFVRREDFVGPDRRRRVREFDGDERRDGAASLILGH